MTIIKIYVDGTKYFELDSIEPLSIKKELPIPKLNQIYSFRIFYQSQRRHYRLLEPSRYFIYKDDTERHLYQYRKRFYSNQNKFIKIDDLSFSQNLNIKIFIRTTNDYFIYRIIINQEKNQYILTEHELSKNDINGQIFRHHIVDVISVEIEECYKIIQIEMNVNYICKKNLTYHLKKYIYKKFFNIEFPLTCPP
jgi:hypothetical protein